MENPFAPPVHRHQDNPPPKTSFQRELEAKIKDRRKRGLAADVTPSRSERDSEEEFLPSDDELLAGFNMTSSSKKGTWQAPGSRKTPTPTNEGKKSPFGRSKSPHSKKSKSPSATEMLFGKKTPTYDEDDEMDDENDDELNGPSNLMMTMKKPWNPHPNKGAKKGSPKLRNSKSKTLDSLHEDEDDVDGFMDGQAKNRPWQAPEYRKSPEISRQNKENQRPQRPKSPNIRGRKTPTEFLDSIEDSDRFARSPRPEPSPRFGVGNKDRESRDSPNARTQEGYDGRKTPTELREAKSPFGRKTPTSDGRRTPQSSDGRKTPTQGRKTPTLEGGRSKSPGVRSGPVQKSSSPEQKSAPPEPKTRRSVMDVFEEDSKVDKKHAKKKKVPTATLR